MKHRQKINSSDLNLFANEDAATKLAAYRSQQWTKRLSYFIVGIASIYHGLPWLSNYILR